MRTERIEITDESGNPEVFEVSIPETVGEYFELQKQIEQENPDSPFA